MYVVFYQKWYFGDFRSIVLWHFAPNLQCLTLIKCNQWSWSCFKQTLEKWSHKPSVCYTIERCEIQSDWCHDADSRAEARGRAHNKQTNSAMQLYFYVKFHVWHHIVSRYSRHIWELRKRSDSYYTILLLVIAPISTLVAESWVHDWPCYVQLVL